MTELRLELDSNDVSIQQLVTAAGAFGGLIREVARAYADTSKDPVRWVVRLEPGSTHVPVAPKPQLEEFNAAAIPEIVGAIATGLATLEEVPERPEYFTDKALEEARQLANLSSDALPINVRNGHAGTSVTKRLAANVDEVLGKPLLSHGTVEGRLEQFNVHGQKNEFSVYDARDGRRVPCRFTDTVTAETIGPAISKRVGVTGLIRTRPNGRRVSIEAESIRILGEEGTPSMSDLFGVLKG